jgi:hypothetical protein
VLLATEIVHSPHVYFPCRLGASQLDRFELAGGGHGIDNRRGAPAADMEKCASDIEELEQDRTALEDASSSDASSSDGEIKV